MNDKRQVPRIYCVNSDRMWKAIGFVTPEDESIAHKDRRKGTPISESEVVHVVKLTEHQKIVEEAVKEARANTFLACARHARIYWHDSVANQLEIWFQESKAEARAGKVEG